MTSDAWDEWARALLGEHLGVKPDDAAKMSSESLRVQLTWRIGGLWGALAAADPERSRTLWDET